MFICTNAVKKAKSYVAPYLKRGRGLRTNQLKSQLVQEHEAEFNSFGAVALLLEQVPLVGTLFQIRNFVDLAL